MTLIEVLVALAIVGLMFGVAVVGLRSVFDVSLKSSARQLASTFRFLSNKAVTDHLYLRLVYDLDSHSYHVEQSTEAVVIAPETSDLESDAEKEDEEAGTEKKAETFVRSESTLLQPLRLPGGIFFKDVSVSYLTEKKETGSVSTYFFPDGYATATMVNLRDEDDKTAFSVELKPLSGQVHIEGEYRELEKK